MKYILIVLGIVVLLVLGSFVLSTPVLKALSVCQREYSLDLDHNMAAAKRERWNRERICIASKPALIKNQSCYSSVQSESLFPVDVVFQILKVIKPSTLRGDVNEVIKLHNSECIDYPEAQILL